MASKSPVAGIEQTQLPVHEISLLNSEEVPPEFVVTEEVQATLSSERWEGSEDLPQLPVIDLSPFIDAARSTDSSREVVTTEVGQACEEWGFFQVVNHGIPESLVEAALGVVRDFFNLPLEERKTYAILPGANQGYGRVLKTKPRVWSDAFRHKLRHRPPPEEDIRPKTLPAYREVMDQYAEEVTKLARLLTTVLSNYLELEPDALQNALTIDSDDYPAITTTSNLYPRCPQPDRVLGIYPHSDGGVMTILCQNHVEGLQVLKGGKWITVKSRENALVVNVANQLEILTNGRLKSSKHRAVVNNFETRLSIAAFCGPGSPDIVIGPLPQFVKANSKPTYPTMVYSDYVSAYFKRDMKANPLSLLHSGADG